jgi:hypothetical protein
VNFSFLLLGSKELLKFCKQKADQKTRLSDSMQAYSKTPDNYDSLLLIRERRPGAGVYRERRVNYWSEYRIGAELR